MSDCNLVSDISLITTVPYKTLMKLCDKGTECICHSVIESIHEGCVETDIDISIGNIKIIVNNDEVHYRFIPSSKLESMLVDALTNDEDPLIRHIESGLADRIINTYKDLI